VTTLGPLTPEEKASLDASNAKLKALIAGVDDKLNRIAAEAVNTGLDFAGLELPDIAKEILSIANRVASFAPMLENAADLPDSARDVLREAIKVLTFVVRAFGVK
jgi:hypothetical protein